mgnify:CR=1 FL=1
MKKYIKCLSVFLVVLMLLPAMSVTALAAGDSTTLTATIPCTITLQVGDHGKVTVGSTDYTGDTSFQEEAGIAVTYTFTPSTLYKVDKVIYNGTDVTDLLADNEYTAPALTGNASLSVTFSLLESGTETNYTVTFHANGHGTAPDEQSVLSGNKAVKPADPTASGWVFKGWYKDADCTQAQEYDFDTPVEANLDLYAKWEKETTDPTDPDDEDETTTPGHSDDDDKDEPSKPDKQDKPTDKNAPKTGDSSRLLMWTILLVASFSVLTGTLIVRRKKKN